MVLTAHPARVTAVPVAELVARRTVAVNLLGRSLLCAWAGASWAIHMRSATFYRMLASLLVLIAAALLASHLGAIPTVKSGDRRAHPRPSSRRGSASVWSPR